MHVLRSFFGFPELATAQKCWSSAIFYHSNDQLTAAEDIIAEMTADKPKYQINREYIFDYFPKSILSLDIIFRYFKRLLSTTHAILFRNSF